MAPKPTDIYLSVIIPAFNEAQRIERTLDKITDYLDKQSYKSEVLVVADGSGDQTLSRVSRSALWRQYINPLDNRVNRGKGAAVRRGMLSANGELLLYSDADLATPIEEVERLIAALDLGYDVAIASRRLPRSEIRVRPPWWSWLIGGVFSGLVQWVALPGIRDSLCGFKLFRRSTGLEIFRRQRIEQFSFDVELIRIARRLGYGVTEVPTAWANHPVSKFRPLADSFQMVVDVGRVRYYDFRGAYAPTPEPGTDTKSSADT